MEHHFGMIELEDHTEAVGIAYVAYEGDQLKFRVCFLQFKANFMERCLGIIKDDEAGNAQLCHLATEFAADASGAAGHHDYLAGKDTMHFLAVDGNFVTTQ